MTARVNDPTQLPNAQEPQSESTWPQRLHHAQAEHRMHFWSENPRQLITRSYLDSRNFIVGNGVDIYEKAIFPAFKTAQHEIIFVTCFWAPSQCIDQLCKTLVQLSEDGKSRPSGNPKLRIQLCFSSRSVVQKLFHTSSPQGYIYKPTEWVSKLSLPAPEALSGLNLQVKSLFFLPFSVMHPKFVIIDRRFALLPSCNLSYESWYEGCLPLTGPIVDRLVSFWKETWGQDDLLPLPFDFSHAEQTTAAVISFHTITLLPSPHHRWPRFRPFLSIPPPPMTPLNVYLDDLLAKANSSIKILTPNLTCQHVISSLLAALARGVDVKIITNRRMMVLEQLLTAGTVTELSVRGLKKRYNKLLFTRTTTNSAGTDVELGHPTKAGTLSVGYFRSNTKYAKSHLKCTIVDDEIVVLGSGNMDRASWYTSQELGVAIEGRDVAREVWGKVDGELEREDREGLGVEWVFVNVMYAHCDTTDFTSYVKALKHGLQFAPTRSLDYVALFVGVIAEHGSIMDLLVKVTTSLGIDPSPSSIRCLDINLTGVNCSASLALNHFRLPSISRIRPIPYLPSRASPSSSSTPSLDTLTLVTILLTTPANSARDIFRNIRSETKQIGVQCNMIAP